MAKETGNVRIKCTYQLWRKGKQYSADLRPLLPASMSGMQWFEWFFPNPVKTAKKKFNLQNGSELGREHVIVASQVQKQDWSSVFLTISSARMPFSSWECMRTNQFSPTIWNGFNLILKEQGIINTLPLKICRQFHKTCMVSCNVIKDNKSHSWLRDSGCLEMWECWFSSVLLVRYFANWSSFLEYPSQVCINWSTALRSRSKYLQDVISFTNFASWSFSAWNQKVTAQYNTRNSKVVPQAFSLSQHIRAFCSRLPDHPNWWKVSFSSIFQPSSLNSLPAHSAHLSGRCWRNQVSVLQLNCLHPARKTTASQYHCKFSKELSSSED